MDNSNYIEFFEFLMISRLIEKDTLSFDMVYELFNQHAASRFEGNLTIKGINLRIFAQLCHEKNLFTVAAQRKFLKIEVRRGSAS